VTRNGQHFEKQSVIKTCKTVLKRCQILLGLDEAQGIGLTHAQLAHSYAVCPATITNIVQSYVKNGLRDIIRYNINPNSRAALKKWTGVPKLIFPDGLRPCPQRTFAFDTPASERERPYRT